jgi:hypothetical protein
MIKVINARRILFAPGRVLAVVHQCRRGHQHCRNSGAGGSDQKAGEVCAAVALPWVSVFVLPLVWRLCCR